MSILRILRVALIVATGFVIGLSFGVAEQSQQAKHWLYESTWMSADFFCDLSCRRRECAG